MNNNIHQIPLIRFLLPFLIGIIMAVYLNLSSQLPLYILACSFCIYLLFLTIKKLDSNYRFRWIFGVLIYINLFLSGFCLTSIKIEQHQPNFDTLVKNKPLLVIGKVIELPTLKNNTIKIVFKINGIKNGQIWQRNNQKLLVYMKKDISSESPKIGDLVILQAIIKAISPPKNPHEFHFKKYLQFHFIHQQTFLLTDQWKVIKKGDSTNIFRIAQQIRKDLISILEKKGIKDEELAIASALILGYKNEINPHLQKAYSSAGAMHILAVSGLHVGVIFLVFSYLLKFLDKVKYGSLIKGVILVLILWGYALLTGLSPSVMRAATMFSFIICAKMMKRNSNIINTLAASAFTLLIYNPLLIMEVGFQLSYLAVIGIVTIQPWIYNQLNIKWWLIDKIWEITAVSIAAQLATFPLGLLYFHQFPNYFLLSNFIIIPLAFLILYFGLLTLSFSFIPVLSDYLALFLKWMIQFMNNIVLLIDQLPYALSENIRFSIMDTWIIYLSIISIAFLITYKKFNYFVISTILLITFFSSSLWTAFNHLNQREIIVYHIPQHSAINFIEGKENLLLTNDQLIKNRSKLLFHVQNNWINHDLKKESIISLSRINDKEIPLCWNKIMFEQQNYLQFYQLRIAILDDQFQFKKVNKKLDIDLLILTKNAVNLTKVLDMFNVKQLVIDSSHSLYQSKKIKKEATQLKINCWSVLIDGVFIKKL